jgi:hypothetical protein
VHDGDVAFVALLASLVTRIRRETVTGLSFSSLLNFAALENVPQRFRARSDGTAVDRAPPTTVVTQMANHHWHCLQ